MSELERRLDAAAAETAFSGVVRVDRGDEVVVAKAYGLADRAHAVPNAVDTRFGIASGTKGLTALAVVGLVEDGLLSLSTTARSVLGSDLPLVGDAVTVEHLLSHTSGIGDYLDEEDELDAEDFLMPVPVHELASTEQYLVALDGHPRKFEPGARFAYSNSGYVLLALIAERTSRASFPELVRRRVCEPAGMHATAFLRSDELPGDAAVGYLGLDAVSRANVFHLPVVGSGDGGIYTTVADVRALWSAIFSGAIVPLERVAEMVRPRGGDPSEEWRYGLGFWVHPEGDAVMLEGMDAGVSFRSVHDPRIDLTQTVVSNTTDGAWPIARVLAERPAG